MPTQIDGTSTGTQEQFWLDDFPAATSDLYGYQQELNLGLIGARPSP